MPQFHTDSGFVAKCVACMRETCIVMCMETTAPTARNLGKYFAPVIQAATGLTGVVQTSGFGVVRDHVHADGMVRTFALTFSNMSTRGPFAASWSRKYTAAQIADGGYIGGWDSAAWVRVYDTAEEAHDALDYHVELYG